LGVLAKATARPPLADATIAAQCIFVMGALVCVQVWPNAMLKAANNPQKISNNE
jgi:hypothetical protein